MVDKFWKVKNLGSNEGELILYGDISSDKPWWDDSGEGIYARQFADDLKSLGNVQNINVHLNSNGGDVSAANAIYTQLKNHAANVTVMIDGIAASAATIIAMAGDIVKAPSNAIFMIHDPLLVLYGYYNSSDMDQMKTVLSAFKNSIVNAYMSKATCSKDELEAMMQNESWMTAEEAKTYGFIDEIMFDDSIDASITNDGHYMVVNSVTFDMSGFKTRPKIGQTPVKNMNNPKAKLKPFQPIKGYDENSCVCQSCNHSDNCQNSSAACCICSNCGLVDQCSKPGSEGCKCSDCSLSQNNCCQPGTDNCMCSNCPTQDTCQKGQMNMNSQNSTNKKLKSVVNKQRKVVNDDMEIKNLEELRKNFPDLCNELVTQAVNKAQQDERERLKAIDEISATVDPKLVAKAKYEQPMSAKDLAFESLKADASKGENFQNQRQQELNPANKVGTVPTPKIDNGDDADIADKIAASANQKRHKGGKQ